MGEQWTDRDDYDNRCERIEAAQRELAPSRTPQQREADARKASANLEYGPNKAAHDALLDIIAAQAARLDMLHDLVEQQQTGARHLAGRIDKMARRVEMLRNWAEQIDGRIIAFQARLIEAFPSVGKPTIREQCEASWTPKEESGE